MLSEQGVASVKLEGNGVCKGGFWKYFPGGGGVAAASIFSGTGLCTVRFGLWDGRTGFDVGMNIIWRNGLLGC